MIEAVAGDSVVLELVLVDGATTFFPQATVYDSAGTLVSTVDLSHVAGGLYQGTWSSPEIAGHYSLRYTVYQDAPRTVVANKYDRVADHALLTGGGAGGGTA